MIHAGNEKVELTTIDGYRKEHFKGVGSFKYLSIKYNKENADFASLQKIQLEILDSVCQSLRKGGIITYSTCTIVSQENFQVVEQFLAAHPNFKQVKLEHNRQDILKDGCILITPELYGSDGFFISQFKRIS